jgi:Cu+-exporting ATPase
MDALSVIGRGTNLSDNPHRREVSKVMRKTIELRISGMHCGGCAGAVRQALTAIPGVESATIDLEPGKAIVTVVSDRVTAKALVASVKKVGYEAQAVKAP